MGDSLRIVPVSFSLRMCVCSWLLLLTFQAQVDEHLHQLHDQMKNMPCTCARSHTLPSPKWFEEADEFEDVAPKKIEALEKLILQQKAYVESLEGKLERLDAEYKKQSSSRAQQRLAGLEKATASIILNNFPLTVEENTLDFTSHPQITDADVTGVLHALSILRPTTLLATTRLIFGKDDASAACQFVTGSMFQPTDGFQPEKILPNVQEIHMPSCTGLLDESISNLAAFPALLRLNLVLCMGLTGTGLVNMAQLSSLKSLYISHTGIHEDYIQFLSAMPSLQELWVHGCAIGNTGLQHVGRIASLETLSIGGCVGCTVSHNISAHLHHLTRLSNLKDLWLWGCDKITAAVAAGKIPEAAGPNALSIVPARAVLKAGCFKVTDAGLAHVGQISSLKRLHIKGCHALTDDGLAFLARLRLVLLESDACFAVTDKGLEKLSRYKPPGNGHFYSDEFLPRSLQELHLRGCHRLTDYALEYAVRFTALQRLTLDDCPGFTPHGIAGLKKLRQLSALCVRTSSRITPEVLSQCLNSLVGVGGAAAGGAAAGASQPPGAAASAAAAAPAQPTV
eukprot:TRINITY_DN8370_c0_g1_i2.p1 TRINITY_DN8370_c0_g1~~TRINITY_DN8370_c0_g1_i2.p1  ORF type:complete len:567 (-),score=13.05 TRINITY_DN8370_c0_g1_i2:185-1885(-)